MKTLSATAVPFSMFAAVTVAVGLAPAAHAAGKVEVSFVKPEQFSDAGRGIDRERTLKSLADYMATLATRLPDGQTLQVEVTDVDLAGELRAGRAQELRVLRGRADWPHLDLNYTLLDGSRTVKSGQAKLADMNYQFGLRGPGLEQTDLPYEKRMLRQWFDQTIVAP